jgi:hypothetical protein
MNTRKLTDEEAAAIQKLPFGKKHPVRILIEGLKPGEKLNVARKDFMWKGKTPNFFCKQIELTGKAKFMIWKKWDKTGWIIERVA